MTVTELLDRIIAAYPGATPEAMKTYRSVFFARLQRHEGSALEAAATEVLGSFKPRYGQPFPIPADFEAHLPSGRLNLPEEGGSIREALRTRAERKCRVFAAWLEGQGAKIRAARPPAVYNACVFMAADLAKKSERVVLTAEQIATCEERALAAGRIDKFGALPRTNEQWDEQREQVRQMWATPHATPSRSAA